MKPEYKEVQEWKVRPAVRSAPGSLPVDSCGVEGRRLWKER